MAFDVSGLAAYVDQSRDDFLIKAIESARSKSLATMHTGIKGTQDINLLSTDVNYLDDSCELTASGDATIGKLPLTVAELALQMKFCQKDLIGKYTQRWLRDGSNGDLDEVTFLYQAIIGDLINGIAKQEEINVWQGDTTGSGNVAKYDGWIKKIDAGSAIDGNVSSATAITTANVITILQDMYINIPAAILDKENLGIQMGMDKFRNFSMALANANLFHYSSEEVDTIFLPGTRVPVYGLNGLNGTDRIFAGTFDNLHWGTDLESDADELVVENGNTPGDRNFYITARWKSGTAISFSDQIVEFTKSV